MADFQQAKDFVRVVKMDEVLRQKSAHMKQAVHAIKQYQEDKNASGIEQAFEIVGRGHENPRQSADHEHG